MIAEARVARQQPEWLQAEMPLADVRVPVNPAAERRTSPAGSGRKASVSRARSGRAKPSRATRKSKRPAAKSKRTAGGR